MATNTQRKPQLDPAYDRPRSSDPLDPVDPVRTDYTANQTTVPSQTGESRVGFYVVLALAVLIGFFLLSYYGSGSNVSPTSTSSESTNVVPPASQPETTNQLPQSDATGQPPAAPGQNGSNSNSGTSTAPP